MLTIYDWFGYDIPIETRYRLIKQAGFDGVLMWWSDNFGRGPNYKNGPDLARAAGLIIENIHTPIQIENDLWLDNQTGQDALARYLECIADCATCEIPTMVVHLPHDSLPITPLGHARIRKIAEAAEHHGVNVALENLGNLRNLAQALAQETSPRVGFCYDCGHHHANKMAGDLLALYGSRMMALHLHDIGGEKAMHQLPFDGPIDWPHAMRAIDQAGYAGPTALEPMNWDYLDMTPEAFLAKACESAIRLDALRHG